MDGSGGSNRTSFLALPPWFEEMVEYIKGFNDEQAQQLTQQPTGAGAEEEQVATPLGDPVASLE